MFFRVTGGAFCAGLLVVGAALAQDSGIRVGGDGRGGNTDDAARRAVGVGIDLLRGAISKGNQAVPEGPVSVSGVVRSSVELTDCDSQNPTMVAACRLVPGSRQVTVQEIVFSPVRGGDAEVVLVALPSADFRLDVGGDRPSEVISMSFAAVSRPSERTALCPHARVPEGQIATGELAIHEEGVGIVMRYEQGGSLRVGGVKFVDPTMPIARNLQTFANRYEVSVSRGSRTR